MKQLELILEEQVERGVPVGAQATDGTVLSSSSLDEVLILEEFDEFCPDARPRPFTKTRSKSGTAP